MKCSRKIGNRTITFHLTGKQKMLPLDQQIAIMSQRWREYDDTQAYWTEKAEQNKHYAKCENLSLLGCFPMPYQEDWMHTQFKEYKPPEWMK